jgi:hypothetical protein
MATYYAINAGGNFSAGGTWSTTATKDASRTGGATAPTNADTCILDDYSGAVTVDHATACLCKILDCTSNGNYAAELTFTADKVLFVSGNVIFSATMTIAGTGTLTINAACALTPGVTFTGSVSLAGTTVTLGADWTITGSLTSASGTNVMNGNTCYIGGSLTATVALSGTTTLTMNGTGTVLSTGTSTISNNLTINTAGTINLGAFSYSTGIFTYVSGTITSVSAMTIRGNCSMNTGGMNFFHVSLSSSHTVTRLSDFNMTGYFRVPAPGYNVTLTGAFNTSCANLFIGSLSFLTIKEGTTLTVTTGISIPGSKELAATRLLSATASSVAYLNFTGVPSLNKIYEADFIDIDASGSAQEIKNYNGGTLTRCTNIRNVNLPVIPSSVSIGG